jgi:diguanylate cyclase
MHAGRLDGIPVTEPTDWKAKHLSSLREMEAEERRWRALEQVLRRLVNRLCAAAMGVDARLDTQLSKLAEANRRGADVTELGARNDSLSDALKALDAATGGKRTTDFTATITDTHAMAAPRVTLAPPPSPSTAPAPPLTATRAAAVKLLQKLALPDPAEPLGRELLARIESAATDAALGPLLLEAADLAGAHADAVAKDRAAAAAVLRQVTERLEEMAAYLGSLSEERRTRRDDADALNTTLLSQVSSLSGEVARLTDLAALRALVAERLETVAAQVRGFSAREAARFVEQSARADAMRERIGELERESRELNRTLEQERRRGRIDPLTNIANRAVFDERLADELQRSKRLRTPVTLLLWDIDRFKGINDSYGHRVGDAVLREVAACLAGRLRATDLVARYGGEEFGMLLVGTSEGEALALAEQLRAMIAALGFHFKGTPVPVTASCGLTELREGDSAATAFDRADSALYRAKDAGRDRCLSG